MLQWARMAAARGAGSGGRDEMKNRVSVEVLPVALTVRRAVTATMLASPFHSGWRSASHAASAARMPRSSIRPWPLSVSS